MTGGRSVTGGLRAAGRVLPRAVTRLRRSPPPPRVALLLLCAVALGATAAGQLVGTWVAPVALLVLPLLGAGLLLERRHTRVVMAVVTAGVVFDVVTLGLGERGVRPGILVVLLVTAAVAYEFARAREDTGLSGASGEGVIVELRRRLEQQGGLPRLPPGWQAEAVVSPADGGPFAGDFVASALTADGQLLEVALVDVSGKGVAAGTRALLLSGALGGLLGAVPPRDFLPAANVYLDRQAWEEGFATAVHVAVSLLDGAFTVVSAGHPPPAVYDAGTGRWSLLHPSGPALGLLPHVRYEAVSGRLERGDALLLYTDGLVEVPGRDLSVGIDKLLGEAERLVAAGWSGGPARVVARLSAGATDDRGLVLLRRSG